MKYKLALFVMFSLVFCFCIEEAKAESNIYRQTLNVGDDDIIYTPQVDDPYFTGNKEDEKEEKKSEEQPEPAPYPDYYQNPVVPVYPVYPYYGGYSVTVPGIWAGNGGVSVHTNLNGHSYNYGGQGVWQTEYYGQPKPPSHPNNWKPPMPNNKPIPPQKFPPNKFPQNGQNQGPRPSQGGFEHHRR